MIGSGALLGGRYRLVARIGSGGMGTVWQATDQVLDRPVAVKVLGEALQAGVQGDPLLRARLRREAQAAARLSHPNVASVFDYGEDAAGVVFIVMELLAGETLAARLRRDGPLPAPLAATVAAQVAAALAAAHQAGVVHRDVKPGNVFLTSGGAVKVLDFGIAATGWDATRSRPDLLIGTPAYIAPELAAGQPAGPAVDVYALGVLLYETLAGHPPFQADDPLALVSAHVTQAPPPLSRVPGVPLGLAAACEWAMGKDPARRPSAAELASTLAALVPAAAMPTVPGLDTGFDPDRTIVTGPGTGPGEGPAGIPVEGVGPPAEHASGRSNAVHGRPAEADPTHTARLPLAELGAVLAGGGSGGGNGGGGHGGPDSDTTVLEWPGRERRSRGARRPYLILAVALVVLIAAGVAVAWQPGTHGRNTAAPRSSQPVTSGVAVTSTSEAQGDQPFAPGAFVGAIGQVWQAITNALNAGQLRQDVATDFGNQLQQLQHDVQQGQDAHDVQKQLNHLVRMVNQRLREGAIASQHAADQIRAALQQLAASLGLGNGNGDNGDSG